MSGISCPNCGFEKADSSQTECPKCGIIYSKYREQKNEWVEKNRKPDIALSFKGKIKLFFVTIVFVFLFLFPWYRYLHEKKIEIIGDRASCSVNLVRTEGSGKSRKTYAYYSFITEKYQTVDSRYATKKLKPGDAVVIIYDPDSPLDSFPVEARKGFLYTMLFSLFIASIYFGIVWFNWPDFREYIRNKLSE